MIEINKITVAAFMVAMGALIIAFIGSLLYFGGSALDCNAAQRDLCLNSCICKWINNDCIYSGFSANGTSRCQAGFWLIIISIVILFMLAYATIFYINKKHNHIVYN